MLAVPLLVYVVGVKSPHVAIGTSALAVAANAAANLVSHWRSGNVKLACAVTYAAFGIAGAAIGSTVGKSIDGDKLLALFGVVMIVIAVSMGRRPPSAGHPEVHLDAGTAGQLVPRLGAAALATGFLSGFFGIGGGFLIVPGLVIATGMPLINAISSSLVSVATFGTTTAAQLRDISGLIDWWIACLLLAGGVCRRPCRRCRGAPACRAAAGALPRLRGDRRRGRPLRGLAGRRQSHPLTPLTVSRKAATSRELESRTGLPAKCAAICASILGKVFLR